MVVTVPAGVKAGDPFQVMANGQPHMLTCPPNVSAGQQVQFMVPVQGGNSQLMQTYEVVVPEGVRQGRPFALMANGQRLMVTCPMHAGPGQTIRFQLPISQNSPEQVAPGTAVPIKYDRIPWIRCLGQDLKLHWVRQDEEDEAASLKAEGKDSKGSDERSSAKDGAGDADAKGGSSGAKGEAKGADEKDNGDDNSSAAAAKDGQADSKDGGAGAKVGLKAPTEAFVRQLSDEMGEGGKLKLYKFVPAEESTMGITVPGLPLGYNDIASATAMPFAEKVEWFNKQIDKLRVAWDYGHIKINIRRSDLLTDSVLAFNNIKNEDMRKQFRFEFLGEPGLDATGLAREYYDQVSAQLFNPDFGFFQHSGIDQMSMQINPGSEMINEDHNQYFRFAGRLMGKALFDKHVIKAHLVRPLYKHLLGWPVVFKDLEHIDSEAFQGMKKLLDLEDVSVCALDFTVMESEVTNNRILELKPDGENITVTNDNVVEYLECIIKCKLLDRVRSQLSHLLQGFYEVVPEVLVSVFDFQEIELLLCGLPNISVEDWCINSEYSGEFSSKKERHKVVKWFWEVIEEDFTEEDRARLLQFATGTGGVPVQGFVALQGPHGVQPFTLNGIKKSVSYYPRAHTCFNRIDLPLYTSKEELKEKVLLAVQMEATGFSIE